MYLGEVANASPNNPKGNKESRSIWVLNEDVLAANDGSWDRPPPQLLWNDALRQRRDDIISSYRARAVWGFKDPRTTITLPFWQEALPGMRLVATFRHPNRVASSLVKRRGLQPASPPMELWADYNRKLLDWLGPTQMPLLCFDWPADTYMRAAEKVASRFGLSDGRNSSFDFFDDRIRTADREASDDVTLSDEIRSIYDALVEYSDAWR